MATIEKRDTGEGITYRAKVRIKGHPAQSATFERLTDARRWAQSTEAAIRERRYFKTSEAQRRTLAELVDRYTRDMIPQKGRWARDQAKQLAWWRTELGNRSLADVTPAVHRRGPRQARSGRDGTQQATRPRYREPLHGGAVACLHRRREGVGMARRQPATQSHQAEGATGPRAVSLGR